MEEEPYPLPITINHGEDPTNWDVMQLKDTEGSLNPNTLASIHTMKDRGILKGTNWHSPWSLSLW